MKIKDRGQVGNLNGTMHTYTTGAATFYVPAGGNVVTIDATGYSRIWPTGSFVRLSPGGQRRYGSALLWQYSVDGSTVGCQSRVHKCRYIYGVWWRRRMMVMEESAPVGAGSAVINPTP